MKYRELEQTSFKHPSLKSNLLLSCILGRVPANGCDRNVPSSETCQGKMEEEKPVQRNTCQTSQVLPAVPSFHFRGSDFSRQGEGLVSGRHLHLYAEWLTKQDPVKKPIGPEENETSRDF